MKIILLERFELQVQPPLTSSGILIPGCIITNLPTLKLRKNRSKNPFKMSDWYTAITKVEEVLVRHDCMESSSAVDHLSCEVLYIPRQV
jgi:hypothetical protein